MIRMLFMGLAVCLPAAVLASVAGCTEPAADRAVTDPMAPEGGAPALGCAVDADCEPAASSCCECPSFALATAEGYGEACSDVACDGPALCPAVEAVCDSGACALRCAPLPCDVTCAAGFAVDAMGCQVCACAATPPQEAECQADADCARVPADCCGCERGGQDTAVPADEAQGHQDGLDCPAEPACPDVYSCMDDQVPRCVAGRCELAPEPDSPVDGRWCGRDDLPPCPDGQVCMLNAPGAEEARSTGAGVCQAP